MSHGAPGWRRGKPLGAFNKRGGRLREAVFLGDPSLMAIDLADLKALFGAGEHRKVECRYFGARLARNAVCGSAQKNVRTGTY